MGSQQVLMIVIGIIVVGVAVAVGIMIFNNMSFSANKTAVANDLQEFSTRMSQYWMLPTSMGGANQNVNNVTEAGVGSSLGFQLDTGIYKNTNENGEYRVISIDNGVVVIAGLGSAEKGGKHPFAQITIDLLTKSADTTLSEETGFN